MRSATHRAAVLALLLPAAAWAGAMLRIDDEKSLFVAVGVRASVGAAGSMNPTTYDLALDAAILSIGGQYDHTLKISLNGGRARGGELAILDAIGMWEPKEWFHLWVGRFLVPTDRATLTGPFFSTSWDFPIASAWPAAVAGRSEGFTVWGNISAIGLKYYAGLFRRPDTLPTGIRDLMGTVRLAWSPIGSEPAYYANGTFFGSRRVLTFAAGARVAPNHVGPMDARGDLWGWNVDAFFESPLGAAGVLTLEAALFRYYPTGPVTASALVPAGTATYETISWIPPFFIGTARMQFSARHQHLFSGRGDRFEGTVNLLLNGHFLRIAATGYGELPGPAWGARLGAQLIL